MKKYAVANPTTAVISNSAQTKPDPLARIIISAIAARPSPPAALISTNTLNGNEMNR